MSAVLGLMLASGLLLSASPWLWPRREVRAARTIRWVVAMRGRRLEAGTGAVGPAAGGAVASQLVLGGAGVGVGSSGVFPLAADGGLR